MDAGAPDPPKTSLPGGLPEAPPCPFCGTGETELMNAFGSHASLATYWCRGCNSPFERMRWARPAPSGSDSGAP